MFMLQFKHVVQLVRPMICNETEVRWEITVRNLSDNSVIVDHFDAVVICNGYG
jgi:hypothetical protein